MAKKLIIAAPSARAYAQAAHACGYEVIALDAFTDADTQAFSTQTFKLKFNGFVLDVADFKRVFCSINLDEVEGFLYGSLFDNCPDVLAWVAARVRLLGNTPEVMQSAKSFDFFKLLDDLEIRHPEVCLNATKHSANNPFVVSFSNHESPFDKLRANGMGGDSEWLSKQLGGTGGTHITLATHANSGDYFQRKIDGKPISMLFVADGKTVQLIGFNEQFIAPTIDIPYRFAGAVGGCKLFDDVQAEFMHVAQKLTTALGLRGINSLDAILQEELVWVADAVFEQQTLWILELNPRLSATFDLYPNLLPAHLQGCAGKLVDIEPQLHTSNAQLIIYAGKALELPVDFSWPDWVADIPAVNGGDSSVIIQKDAPICTVLAQAAYAEAAHNLVLQRAKTLREMMLE